MMVISITTPIWIATVIWALMIYPVVLYIRRAVREETEINYRTNPYAWPITLLAALLWPFFILIFMMVAVAMKYCSYKISRAELAVTKWEDLSNMNPASKYEDEEYFGMLRHGAKKMKTKHLLDIMSIVNFEQATERLLDKHVNSNVDDDDKKRSEIIDRRMRHIVMHELADRELLE